MVAALDGLINAGILARALREPTKLQNLTEPPARPAHQAREMIVRTAPPIALAARAVQYLLCGACNQDVRFFEH